MTGKENLSSPEGLAEKIANGSATLEELESGAFSAEEEKNLKEYVQWLVEEADYQYKSGNGEKMPADGIEKVKKEVQRQLEINGWMKFSRIDMGKLITENVDGYYSV